MQWSLSIEPIHELQLDAASTEDQMVAESDNLGS